MEPGRVELAWRVWVQGSAVVKESDCCERSDLIQAPVAEGELRVEAVASPLAPGPIARLVET